MAFLPGVYRPAPLSMVNAWNTNPLAAFDLFFSGRLATPAPRTDYRHKYITMERKSNHTIAITPAGRAGRSG